MFQDVGVSKDLNEQFKHHLHNTNVGANDSMLHCHILVVLRDICWLLLWHLRLLLRALVMTSVVLWRVRHCLRIILLIIDLACDLCQIWQLD